ncbi:hypothetical protein CCHL11_02779, partial [Colletotrichum chlorophyti]
LHSRNAVSSFAIRDYVIIPNTSQPQRSILALGTVKWVLVDFKLSNSITIFKAGPIRLLFTYLAILYRASKVYIINYVKERLKLAASIRAILINFIKDDPVA